MFGKCTSSRGKEACLSCCKEEVLHTSPNVNAVRAPPVLESEWGIFVEKKT